MKRNIYITTILVSVLTFGAAAFAWSYKNVISEESSHIDASISPENQLSIHENDSFPADLASDLLKINKAHAALDNIKITNRYLQISTLKDNSEETDERTFSLYRKGEKLWYDAGDIQRIQDSKYNILVNKEVKMILVFDPDRNFSSVMKDELKNFNPDSCLLWADKAIIKDAEKGNKAYTIFFSIMPYSKIDIDFNMNTNLLNSITYYFDDFDEDDDYTNQRTTINMSFEKLDKKANSLFDLHKYFTEKKDELVPTQAYAGYELYNNMKK